MCIAIVKTKDAVITDEELKNCFENNPDGAGLAYSKDNTLYYIKGIFDEKVFIQAVREAENECDGAMLIHCRIGTSGLKDKENCHPHVVNNQTVMIHNGILDIDVPKNSNVSDTVIFVRDLLAPLKADFMKDEAILNLIEHAIGTGNKFCFLNNKGEYAIVNESAGEWRDGVWFSNRSYETKKITYTYDYKPYSYFGHTWGYPYEDEEDDLYESEFKHTTMMLSDAEYNYIKDMIGKLTDEEMMLIGEDPIYDIWCKQLKSDFEFEGEGEDYLWEIDDILYSMYEEKYMQRGIDQLKVA